jgi:outer membrane lipoprotein-sorting protein
MPRRQPFLLFALCLCVTPTLTGQQSKPQRDSSALSFLSQALGVSGGSAAIAGIADFTASGSITYSWGSESVQGSATIKGRGAEQFRIDSQVPDGTSSMIVSNGAGVLNLPDGTGNAIGYQNALNVGNLTLPIIAIYTATVDTSVSTIDDGVVPLGSGQAHQITIQQNLPSTIDPTGQLSTNTKRDYFFDPSSLQLLQVHDTVASNNAAVNNGLQHIIGFSNYQMSNGILVPLSVSESVNGQTTWSVALTSVTFNTGLADSDFQF